MNLSLLLQLLATYFALGVFTHVFFEFWTLRLFEHPTEIRFGTFLHWSLYSPKITLRFIQNSLMTPFAILLFAMTLPLGYVVLHAVDRRLATDRWAQAMSQLQQLLREHSRGLYAELRLFQDFQSFLIDLHHYKHELIQDIDLERDLEARLDDLKRRKDLLYP